MGCMGIVNKSCDVYFGQVKLRRLSRNRVDSSGGWLNKIKTTKVEFKSVYDGRIEGI